MQIYVFIYEERFPFFKSNVPNGIPLFQYHYPKILLLFGIATVCSLISILFLFFNVQIIFFPTVKLTIALLIKIILSTPIRCCLPNEHCCFWFSYQSAVGHFACWSPLTKWGHQQHCSHSLPNHIHNPVLAFWHSNFMCQKQLVLQRR